MKKAWRVTVELIPLFWGMFFIILLAWGAGYQRGLLGFTLFAIALILVWIGVILTNKMAKEVDRFVPAKSLFECIDNRRIWREHERLFPNSQPRRAAKRLFILAVCCAVGGFVLAAAGL